MAGLQSLSEDKTKLWNLCLVIQTKNFLIQLEFWKIQSSQILFANEYFRLNNFSWQLRSIFKWFQWLNCTWARIQAETINKGLHKVIFASKKYLQSTQEFNLQERQLFQIGFMLNWFVIMIWKSSFWELEQMWAISKGPLCRIAQLQHYEWFFHLLRQSNFQLNNESKLNPLRIFLLIYF